MHTSCAKLSGSMPQTTATKKQFGSAPCLILLCSGIAWVKYRFLKSMFPKSSLYSAGVH